jgi:DNA-3-methyladenine glycosylase
VEIIQSSFLSRSALAVAPDLIGCTLVRKFPNGQQLRGTIVETEAYEFGDPACHAYQKRTDRNAIMFGPAGYAYVYLIYGMYHCVNVVTDRDDFASAVLIRALQMEAIPPDLPPEAIINPKDKPDRIAAGPGKLCRVMAIDRTLSKTKLDASQSLWLEHRTQTWQQSPNTLTPSTPTPNTHKLIQTTRIGLSQGVDLPWRWYLKNCPAVSKI